MGGFKIREELGGGGKIFFKIYLLYFKYASVSHALCPERSEEGAASHESTDTNAYALPCLFWKPVQASLQERPVLFNS